MKPTAQKKPVSKSMPQASRSGTLSIELPAGLWERIAQKAYALWEKRGSREGYALQDWLDAETIVMEEIHEARE